MLLTGETHGEIDFSALFCKYIFLLHCCCSVVKFKHFFFVLCYQDIFKNAAVYYSVLCSVIIGNSFCVFLLNSSLILCISFQ